MCENHDGETVSGIQKFMMSLYGKWVDDTLGFYELMGKMGRIPLMGGPVRFFAGQYGKYVHGGRVATLEESLDLLAEVSQVTVMDCACRVKYQNCSSPIRTCLGINAGAEVLGDLRNENLISNDEAAAIIKDSYKHGLIRTIIYCVTPNKYVICNCCTCCCIPHRLRSEFGIKHAVDNGKLAARINSEQCSGCLKCKSICPSGAIKPEQGTVDLDKCLGCGLCLGSCPSAALEMVERVADEHPPAMDFWVRVLTYTAFFGLILPLAVTYKLSKLKF